MGRIPSNRQQTTNKTDLHAREGQDAAEDRVEDAARRGDEQRAGQGEDGLLLGRLGLLQPDDPDEEADGCLRVCVDGLGGWGREVGMCVRWIGVGPPTQPSIDIGTYARTHV